MADNSNTFSMSGLPRNKKLSGLHSHRPENIDLYFERKSIKAPPQFVSILNLSVTSMGYNYSKNTTLTFPTPEHPSGIRASGYPLFSICKNSFSISNSGSNYSIGDAFPIFSSGDLVGSFTVTNTGISGRISDYNAFSIPLDLKNISLPIIDFSSNPTASISNNDKYNIPSAVLVFPGLGYQTYSRITGSGIIHDPVISNSGSSSPLPSGLVIKSSIDPYVYSEAITDSRVRETKTDKFNSTRVALDRQNHYMIINNFSLGDFPRNSSGLPLTPFYSGNLFWNRVKFSGNGDSTSPFVKASISAGTSDGMSIKVTANGYIKIIASNVTSNTRYTITVTPSSGSSFTNVVNLGTNSGYSGSLNSSFVVRENDKITFNGTNVSYSNLSIFYSSTILI